MEKALIIKAPDDWHVHLRDNEITPVVLRDTCSQFRRALVMPNLSPPVATTDQALSYRKRILDLIPGINFTAFMTIYMTSLLSPDEIVKASKTGDILAVKWYPKGATTNSDHGISSASIINNEVIQSIIDCDMVLCVHGESVKPEVDPFDRESLFLEEELGPIQKKFPKLRVVLEHITTRKAVEYVRQTPNTGATITAHHLAFDRRALFDGGLRPHWYCLPLLKRLEDRKCLIEAATSGEHKFFLGTDSAPHTSERKESSCGCAGCYTAPHAIETYASIFGEQNCLHRLEYFSSIAGAEFYRKAVNKEELLLEPKEWEVPDNIPLVNGKKIVPLCSGMVFHWKAKMVLPE